MLKQRVITAIVLLIVLLPAIAEPRVWPFALLMVLAVAVAAWEWARLNSSGGATSIAVGVIVAIACCASVFSASVPIVIWWVASVVWLIGGTLILRSGVARWSSVPVIVRLVFGMAALWAAWLALTTAKTIGVNFLLSVLSLVWAADIAAYFGGKAFGRRKLAPSISPGKSWAGVYSGAVGVLVLATVWIQLDRTFEFDSTSLYSEMLERFGIVALVVSLLALSGLSVMGDLVESLAKRSAGAKDSSGLLPGHGGLLDRIDAMLPVLPLALALIHLPKLF